jgi:hypothetical protein
MRYLKALLFSVLVIGLMSGSAFAAASLNAGNTTIASELVPAAGLGVPTVNTGYQPAGTVAVSSQIKISLTNGTFTAGSNVAICDNPGLAAGTYGTAVVPVVPANTSVTITTTKLLASGAAYHFEPAAVCGVVLAPLTNVNIAAGALGGSVVTMIVDNALAPGDTNVYATAPIVTLVDQLSVQLITPAVDVLDFGASPVMSKFKAGGSGTATTSVAKLVLLSNETLGTKVVTNAGITNTTCIAWTPGVEALSFTATPGGTATTMGTGFNATTAFTAGPTAYTLKAAIASTDASATGNAILLTNLNAFVCGAGASATDKGTGANQITNTLTVLGTVSLTSRSYKLAVGTTTSGTILAAARTILAATTAWTWGMDASQYYIPLVGSNPATGRETYIKLQSKNLSSGSNGVSVAILANDGTTAATFTGAITAGTPLTITGAELVAAATAAGKTVNGMAGFAVIVTVNAPETDVFAYANMIDASGAKRIPVKTVGGLISE